MSDDVEYGMSKYVNDARIISLLVDPLRAGVDYRIRVMVNGKYYVGELELSE